MKQGLATEGNWRSAAACRLADPELFFPIAAFGKALAQVAEAKAICARCPVRRQCLAFALRTRQPHGIWGGMTEEERASIRGRDRGRPDIGMRLVEVPGYTPIGRGWWPGAPNWPELMPNAERKDSAMPFAAFKSGEAAGTRAMSVSPQSPPVVAICGEVDIQSAPELREEFLRVIRRRGPQLTIDLGGVTFMDCAGLTMLLATRRRAQLEGGWVRLVEVPPQARRMISLLHLDRAFGLGTLRSAGGRRGPCDFMAK